MLEWSGVDGVDGWMDTPKNVMTTRAPAVLKIHMIWTVIKISNKKQQRRHKNGKAISTNFCFI